MSQADICEFLRENPDEWYTVKEIAKKLEVGIVSTTAGVRRLKNHNEVLWEQTTGSFGRHFYVYKHKGD